MGDALSRIWRNIKERRHVDAYAAAFIAFILAVLSVIGDVVPEQIRWAAILAGVGILERRLVPAPQLARVFPAVVTSESRCK